MASVEPEEDIGRLYDSVGLNNLDPLFLRLGEFNPDLPLGATPHDPATFIAAGRDWWQRHGPSVRSYVCCNGALRKVTSKGGSSFAEAAFGVLAGHFGGPIATYASVIFVKEAVGDALDEAVIRKFKSWCGDAWQEPTKVED
ncbi:hypothetical protein [Lichenifustis flavocetrariae]|uniref:Uncharacterized protein n=1 Tax=Lichenifustis flavocetrariae TaxID=2949735 RepID=A0AA41Z1W6_9HYPH|nr:hypothetical protein [Lichenifustis flavocetrariae]MCW6511467.1 hypothetical protein [Lichenifustis flavocetrariae]